MSAYGGPLALMILQALAQAQEEQRGSAGVSLPRLGKRLGLGVSALMRQLTLMSDAALGGQPGPGWVRVTQVEGRWTACLTDTGRAMLAVPSANEVLP